MTGFRRRAKDPAHALACGGVHYILRAILFYMQERSPYLIPVAILVSAFLLSVGVYVTRTNTTQAPANRGDIANLLPVGEGDHILGNPEAPVMFVSYGDLDCEYCKRSHEVFEQIIAEYGTSGEVAYTYRHFPLVSLHPNAGTHAQASECVASLGGAQTFWQFLTGIATEAPGASQFDPLGYSALAERIGVSSSALTTCLEENRFSARVARDFENALAIGATAAPFTVVTISGADSMTVSGHLPYAQMKELVEHALEKYHLASTAQ